MKLSDIITFAKAALSIAGAENPFAGGLTGITPASVSSLLGTFGPIFEQVGAAIAPQATPAVHGIIGAISAFVSKNDVLAAQVAINAVGAYVTGWNPILEDGIYGPQTAVGVTMVQTFLKINPDSWFGEITAKAIEAFLQSPLAKPA